MTSALGVSKSAALSIVENARARESGQPVKRRRFGGCLDSSRIANLAAACRHGMDNDAPLWDSDDILVATMNHVALHPAWLAVTGTPDLGAVYERGRLAIERLRMAVTRLYQGQSVHHVLFRASQALWIMYAPIVHAELVDVMQATTTLNPTAETSSRSESCLRAPRLAPSPIVCALRAVMHLAEKSNNMTHATKENIVRILCSFGQSCLIDAIEEDDHVPFHKAPAYDSICSLLSTRLADESEVWDHLETQCRRAASHPDQEEAATLQSFISANFLCAPSTKMRRADTFDIQTDVGVRRIEDFLEPRFGGGCIRVRPYGQTMGDPQRSDGAHPRQVGHHGRVR